MPDHPVLSRFRTRLTAADAWDGLLEQVNRQIHMHDITVRKGCHVDASITQSPRKPKTRPAYEVISDREERDDEADAQSAMRVIEVTHPGVNIDARWVRKSGKPLVDLLDKANIQLGIRVHADKAYCSQKHRDALKSRSIKNGIQDKAAKNGPLTRRQLQRNSLIAKARYVVERTFGSQARWFNAKILRYRGLALAHAWHTLLAMAYNLKRLPRLFADRRIIRKHKDIASSQPEIAGVEGYSWFVQRKMTKKSPVTYK